MKNTNKLSISIVVVGFFVVASAAYAQTATTTKGFFSHGGHPPFSRPIAGVVTAVNGSDLTVTVGEASSAVAAITNYTVNASTAKILRSGTTTTLSSIQISDKVAVIGTVSGTNITAKLIIDGILPHTTGPPAWKKGGHAGSITGRSFASSTRPFVRPTAFGSVSAITSGSSFTLAQRTKTGTTTMTIDTDSSTTFREGTTTASFSNLAVGNLVAVTGTTTSTNQVLASKVMIINITAIKSFRPLGKGNAGKGSGFHGNGSFKGFASTTPQ